MPSKKTGKKHSFEIETKERSYLLYAETQYEMEKWMNTLSKVSRFTKVYREPSTSLEDKVILSIKCMMCERCEERVQQIIIGCKGVTTLKLDPNEETATINGKFDLSEVCNSLEEAGFLPNLMQQQ